MVVFLLLRHSYEKAVVVFLEFFHHFDEFDINKNYSFFRKVISMKNGKDAFFVKIYNT